MKIKLEYLLFILFITIGLLYCSKETSENKTKDSISAAKNKNSTGDKNFIENNLAFNSKDSSSSNVQCIFKNSENAIIVDNDSSVSIQSNDPKFISFSNVSEKLINTSLSFGSMKFSFTRGNRFIVEEKNQEKVDYDTGYWSLSDEYFKLFFDNYKNKNLFFKILGVNNNNKIVFLNENKVQTNKTNSLDVLDSSSTLPENLVKLINYEIYDPSIKKILVHNCDFEGDGTEEYIIHSFTHPNSQIKRDEISLILYSNEKNEYYIHYVPSLSKIKDVKDIKIEKQKDKSNIVSIETASDIYQLSFENTEYGKNYTVKKVSGKVEKNHQENIDTNFIVGEWGNSDKTKKLTFNLSGGLLFENKVTKDGKTKTKLIKGSYFINNNKLIIETEEGTNIMDFSYSKNTDELTLLDLGKFKRNK